MCGCIKEWCDKWSMCLNSGKCKTMHFGSKNPNIEYNIENGNERVVLDLTEVEKDLGVILLCQNLIMKFFQFFPTNQHFYLMYIGIHGPKGCPNYFLIHY